MVYANLAISFLKIAMYYAICAKNLAISLWKEVININRITLDWDKYWILHISQDSGGNNASNREADNGRNL